MEMSNSNIFKRLYKICVWHNFFAIRFEKFVWIGNFQMYFVYCSRLFLYCWNCCYSWKDVCRFFMTDTFLEYKMHRHYKLTLFLNELIHFFVAVALHLFIVSFVSCYILYNSLQQRIRYTIFSSGNTKTAFGVNFQ